MARKYVNITDFEKNDFIILQQIGFKSVAGGVVTFNNIKVGLDQLDVMNKKLELLKTWMYVNNSSNRNPEHKKKYQTYVWIKLIKRECKVSLKNIIGIFEFIYKAQKSADYKNKFLSLFLEKIETVNLSEEWKDRLIRTVK